MKYTAPVRRNGKDEKKTVSLLLLFLATLRWESDRRNTIVCTCTCILNEMQFNGVKTVSELQRFRNCKIQNSIFSIFASFNSVSKEGALTATQFKFSFVVFSPLE